MADVEDVAEAASEIDWKLKVGAQILPHIMKWFGDSGNSKAQEEALRRMMQIAMIQMLRFIQEQLNCVMDKSTIVVTPCLQMRWMMMVMDMWNAP